MIFGTGNPLLWYRTDIRVRRTSFSGTRCIFRGPGHAAAPCGTEYARGAKNRLLWYAMRFQEILCADNYLLLIQEPEHPERDLIVEDVFSIVLDHIAIFDVFNLFLPFLSPANLKGLSVNLKI